MKYYLVLFLFIITCVHYAIQIKPQNRSNFLSNNKNNCDLCLEKTGDICAKCIKGAYLYNHECYFSCPGETLADNYSLTCKKESESPVFIKAYTLGRCMNKCGSIFHDCSCDVRCKKAGDCCSDFKYCEFIGKEASKQCTIVGCEACTQNTCLKCNDGLFYYKNQCVRACPSESRTISGNSLCIDIPKCKIDNCAECDTIDNSNSKCSKCIHGFFLHENECSEFCPAGTRANRVDFTCVNKSTFAFSMIFPSKFSCKSQCGLEKTKLRRINNISLEKNCQIENNEPTKQDCSCHHNCLKDGNCCDDFETECLDELKKEKCKTCETCHEGKCLKCLENSELHRGDCNCRKGFYYDIEKDRCLDINSKIIKSDKEKLQASKTSENSNSILSKMLADSFNSPNAEDSFKAMPGLGYNMVLSGNTTMNIFSGNDHPIITNESVVNENSFNNSTKIEKNINSHNIIIRGYDSEYTSVEDTQHENPQNYNNGIGIVAPPNQSYKYHRYKPSISPDSQGGTIQRKLSNRQSERKKKIIIDKHFHMDHNKNYPEDLEHEEGSPITMKELLKNSYNKSKKKITSEPKVLVVKPNKPNNAPQQEVVSVKSATGAKQMKVKNSSQFAAPAAVKFGNLEKDDKLEPDNLQIITPVPMATSSNNQISFSDQNKILSPSLNLDAGKPSIQNLQSLQKKHNTLLKEILSEKKPTLEISNPPLGNNSISEKINKNPEEEKENPIQVGSIMGNSENLTNIDNIPLSKLKNKNLDHLVETTTDANKKIQVNINIPNASVDDKNPNVLHRNRVVVYNHYFINDKSMTMHQPKNPNVFNFFGNECKDGKCVNSDEIKSLKNAKFIDDKNFHEFNTTLNVQKSGVNLILDRGSNELKLPESQKKEISEFPNEIKQGSNRLKRVLKK